MRRARALLTPIRKPAASSRCRPARPRGPGNVFAHARSGHTRLVSGRRHRLRPGHVLARARSGPGASRL